jgi:2-polyprenyl-3-methyl-5-hydroxy-6-metoxy-1,4-benzoquinol methylase
MAKSFCPICNKKRLYLVYPANIKKDYFDKSYLISGSEYGKHLDIYRCLRCGVVFEDMSLVREKIANFYQDLHDQAYEDERQNRTLAFKRIVSKIREFKPSGKLLDVGCATGSLLVEARNSGYDVYGIEPSSWASEIARKKYNLNVVAGCIEEKDFPREYFDIVTLIDVIEHLYEPKLALQKISRLIKEKGLICVVTPNIESFTARIFGEKWWHIRPSHFCYFPPKTMNALLKATGFEIIFLRTYKWYFSFSYLFQRVLRLLSFQRRLNFEILKKLTVGINLRDSMEVYAIKK